MNHHGTGKVVEGGAEFTLQPLLKTEAVVPGDALKQGVDQTDDEEGADQHGVETGAFGDTTTDDGRNSRSKGQQEEELGEIEAVIGHQSMGAGHEALTIGQIVTEEEVGEGGDAEIGDDLDQGIHLVLATHSAQLQEGKTGVHGQHHNGAKQDKQGI